MVQMQFCAIILLTLLTLKLLLLPRKVGVTPIVSTARWLMTVGIALLGVQFLLQYILGLRAMRRTLQNYYDRDMIAQHCGFSDRTYFQNVFRKHTGMTPAQYSELT